DPAQPRARPRADEELGARGTRARAVRRPALRRGGGGVRGGRRARSDQRLRALLPRSFAAADGPSSGGAPSAGARQLPASRARRLPALPRPLAAPRGVGLAQLVGGVDQQTEQAVDLTLVGGRELGQLTVDPDRSGGAR